MISADIICDSLAPCGKRLTTFLLVYPRFIHCEVMTHRALSRNAASSRAIPVEKMIRMIKENHAKPIYWGKNQKGMQATEELGPQKQEDAERIWWNLCRYAIVGAESLIRLGAHKQIANRVLEPYAHMTTVMSATEWDNFFALRAHPEAQPEFQCLARKMLKAYVNGQPKRLKYGEWHLPFGDKELHDNLRIEEKLMISVARCARTSYLNFDGQIEFGKDYVLHDDLLESGHMSPFEHQGRAEVSPVRSGNFVGFIQYRKMIPNENRVLGEAKLREMAE